MKVLTLHAPWAWAIAYLRKDVENRTWAPPKSLIGQRIAIHAGSVIHWKPDVWRDVFWVAPQGSLNMMITKLHQYYPELAGHGLYSKVVAEALCSQIVCTAKLTGVLHPRDNFIFASMDGWHATDQYGWKLEDVQVLKRPIRCKGKQWLWNFDERLLEGAL